MIKYKLTHKETKETLNVWAKNKESALQIVCSEQSFSDKLKNNCGWWERSQVEIIEDEK